MRRSHRISSGGALHRKGERTSRVVPPFAESPRCLSPFQGNLFSLHCLDFLAEDRLTPRWHVGHPCGKTSGTRSGGLRKGQSPCKLLGGLSGILYRRCRGLRSCVESVPEPEHSSPVLTWILGIFWSLPSGVSPRLEWGHARVLSSRAVAAVARFPSRGSRDLWLSLETFPRGFPTGLSHEAFPQGCPTCHRGVSRSSA